jgi:tetratricopeptide (TPR) repeat protein
MNLYKFLYGALILWVATAGVAAHGEALAWQNGWTAIPVASATGDAESLVRTSDELTRHADTQEKLAAVNELLEKALAVDPVNYGALWRLSRNLRFYGQAYAEPTRRHELYVRAIQLVERALYTNPDFKAAIDLGGEPWTAASTLTKHEVEAMHYYFLGVFSMFLTELDANEQRANAFWLQRVKALVDRMLEVDPEWGGGHPYYDRALYFSQLPAAFGGDLEQARADFAKAIEIGPKWVNNFYMRARVYRVKAGDREGFVGDLEHIARMDPHESDAPYPNSVFYIAEAKRMLEHVDDYFKQKG